MAARCGRPVRSSSRSTVPGAASSRATASSGTPATSARGTATMKIDCQETSSVSSPPIPGPRAAPVAPAAAQDAAALRSDPTTPGISSRAAVTAAAPPRACTQRATISASRPDAAAQAAEAPAKTASPAAATRPGPKRRATTAAGTAASASTRLKETSTQVTPVTEVSSSL